MIRQWQPVARVTCLCSCVCVCVYQSICLLLIAIKSTLFGYIVFFVALFSLIKTIGSDSRFWELISWLMGRQAILFYRNLFLSVDRNKYTKINFAMGCESRHKVREFSLRLKLIELSNVYFCQELQSCEYHCLMMHLTRTCNYFISEWT